jgi:uncharacterized protein YndB with AHSA1/START domain
MITFKQSAKINAPVEQVFSVVSDPKRIPEWRRDVPRISEISGEMKVGTTFVEEVHFMGNKHLLMKVTEFIPNKKLVIEARSGMPMLPLQSFTFTPEGNKTRVDLSVIMKTSGFFSMMEFMLPAQLKKIWERYFENLDKLVSR